MKLGQVEAAYFQGKFGVDIFARFAEPLRQHAAARLPHAGRQPRYADPAGLLRVDELLHEFFRPEHRGARYT